jgi:hypothetical protein
MLAFSSFCAVIYTPYDLTQGKYEEEEKLYCLKKGSALYSSVAL